MNGVTFPVVGLLTHSRDRNRGGHENSLLAAKGRGTVAYVTMIDREFRETTAVSRAPGLTGLLPMPARYHEKNPPAAFPR
jgi:hypothetical protein